VWSRLGKKHPTQEEVKGQQPRKADCGAVLVNAGSETG